jgi:glycosyltransferase involved in cell wall biosynthesis
MIKLDLICDISSPSGYSTHARDIVKALHGRVDLRVIDNKHDSATIDLSNEESGLLAQLTSKTRSPDVVIHFETPEFYRTDLKVPKIGFTMWETTRIPDTDLNDNPRLNWVKQMNQMNAIWTGCSSAAAAFAASGVTVPIEVYRGPVDTNFYVAGSEELHISDVVYADDTFVPKEKRLPVLGCIAQWTARKNITGLLITALSRFKRDELVIVLKTYGSSMTKEQNDAIVKQIQGIRTLVNNPNAPRIVLLLDKLTDRDIVKLYHSFDFIVNPSSGEGLCLPLVQGMSAGCVPITNAFSAPSDYVFNTVNGFTVPYDLTPAVFMRHNPWYRYDQYWGQISMYGLERAIRDALALRKSESDFRAMAQRARETIVQQMSLDVFADRAVAGLENLLNGNKT